MCRGAVVFLLLATSCVVHHVAVPHAPYIDPRTLPSGDTPISLFVQTEQVESDEFRQHEDASLAIDAKNYNLAVLGGLKREIEERPGVRVDPRARFRIVLRSELPESSRNHPLVGCASLLTVFVIPVWNTYEYPITVVIYDRGREIKRQDYSYRTTMVIGWLVPVANLLVTSWADGMYISTETRNPDARRLLKRYGRRVSDDILRTLSTQPSEPDIGEVGPLTSVTLREQ